LRKLFEELPAARTDENILRLAPFGNTKALPTRMGFGGRLQKKPYFVLDDLLFGCHPISLLRFSERQV
jgi:hypothetical protein